MSIPSCEDFSKVAESSGLLFETIFETPAGPLLKLANGSSCHKPAVLISAGIHGDEPAPVIALFNLLNDGFFSSENFDWQIYPILNPTGLRKGTRENAEGIDLNLDFLDTQSPEILAYKTSLEAVKDSIVMSLNLHEEWEAKGFYLYALSPDDAREYGEAILNSIGAIGPIENSENVDGHPSSNGLILPLEFVNDDSLSDGWPEAIHLYRTSPHIHFTMESPSCLPTDTRADLHIQAVKTAINLIGSID